VRLRAGEHRWIEHSAPLPAHATRPLNCRDALLLVLLLIRDESEFVQTYSLTSLRRREIIPRTRIDECDASSQTACLERSLKSSSHWVDGTPKQVSKAGANLRPTGVRPLNYPERVQKAWGGNYLPCTRMRIRRIAVLIDGSFFLKRLPKLVEPHHCTTPTQIADAARYLCKRHVQRITRCRARGNTEALWLDHVYGLFYYDAAPYDGVAHHPVLNRPMEFGKSAVADFRRNLYEELRRRRKFALRLGEVVKSGSWRLSPHIRSTQSCW
jgi:hypothetical protein